MSGLRYAESTPADLTGRVGKAWKVDSAGIWTRLGERGAHPELTVANWVVEARYAHPVWHSYHLICYSLRPHPSVTGDPLIYLEGATHELALHALDPGAQRALNDLPRWLLPSNFGAQIIAESDEAARARIEQAVSDIIAGELSPDTDHRRAWIARFGVNMIKREWRDVPEGLIAIKGDQVTVIGTGAGVMRALESAAPRPDPKDMH